MKHVSINQFISIHRYTIKWKKQNSKVMWDLPKVLLPNPVVSFSAAGTGHHCPISSVSLTPCLYLSRCKFLCFLQIPRKLHIKAFVIHILNIFKKLDSVTL